MEIMETFIENQGVISGNNATIAENQMKVYEAGVRAGLAQDPDYQEGYEDGMDAAIGGAEWQDILNGNTPVGKAKLADRATEADRAKMASAAISAEVANRAREADHSYEADHAAHSVNAEEADLANEAAHASEADHSEESTHAAKADYANNADHATTATYASVAESATTATTANVAMGLDEGYVFDIGFAKFIRGSYIGTGTYGEGNPTVIEFPSQVKLLILLPIAGRYYPTGVAKLGTGEIFSPYYSLDTPLPIFGTEHRPCTGTYVSSENEVTRYYLYVTEFSSRVSFYSTRSAAAQRNGDGETYEYIAIL